MQTARLDDVTLEAEAKDLIRQAADRSLVPFAEFVVTTLLERAQEVMGDEGAIRVLTNPERDAFLQMLEDDAEASPELTQAMRAARDLL